MSTKRIPRRRSHLESLRELRVRQPPTTAIDVERAVRENEEADIAVGPRSGTTQVRVAPFVRHWTIGGPTHKNDLPLVGLGWQPDVCDFRDRDLLATHCLLEKNKDYAKTAICEHIDDPEGFLRRNDIDWVDWSAECSPIENQQALGSCTAHAVVGVLEFMMRRAPRWDDGEAKSHVELSKLFLYKVTRNLLGSSGDTGAFIRTTFKAAAAFGVPPEETWPYQIERFEDEPSAFHYSYANNFKSLMYTRLDSRHLDGHNLLWRIKLLLAHSFLVAFGFPLYTSHGHDGNIPYPTQGDSLLGGHAVTAVGFDDNRIINGEVGALIIRNSWGNIWGDVGYGYLPYAYVTNGLARDFWTVFKSAWIRNEIFE